MSTPSVVILGGGLSGVAAAYTLAHAGYESVTVLESGGSLGGLAGSFEQGGHFYPLGYHHILHRDRTLLFFLDRIGALPDVRWRSIQLLFHLNDTFFDLGHPGGFLRFPMSVADKARFIRLMARAFRKTDWSDWLDRTAADLIDEWAGPGVRRTLFEPLCQLKFELPCDEISGAWLGARLHFREGSAPFGYIPGANWTKVLCDGVTRLLSEAGVHVRLRAAVAKLHTLGERVEEAELTSGERIRGDHFVSSVPTEVYGRLVPHDETPHLDSIRYTGLLSVVCATRQRIHPEAYWTNLASVGHTACAIFLLDALNPTIGGPGETCVNFVTHLQSRDRPLFREPDAQLLERYRTDFRRVFGFDLEPFWTHITRVPMYSPVFHRSYRNPPVRSASWRNVYFAGNYRTFPSIVSTGTALRSGLETGRRILDDHGQQTDLPAAAAGFRLRSMPRA
jgi:protoporphyrinogen oxidase